MWWLDRLLFLPRYDDGSEPTRACPHTEDDRARLCSPSAPTAALPHYFFPYVCFCLGRSMLRDGSELTIHIGLCRSLLFERYILFDEVNTKVVHTQSTRSRSPCSTDVVVWVGVVAPFCRALGMAAWGAVGELSSLPPPRCATPSPFPSHNALLCCPFII